MFWLAVSQFMAGRSTNSSFGAGPSPGKLGFSGAAVPTYQTRPSSSKKMSGSMPTGRAPSTNMIKMARGSINVLESQSMVAIYFFKWTENIEVWSVWSYSTESNVVSQQ